jgi:hypothetical protein
MSNEFSNYSREEEEKRDKVCVPSCSNRHRNCTFLVVSYNGICLPNLAPSNYSLFLKLNEHLSGLYFPDEETTMMKINGWLEIQKNFFQGHQSSLTSIY